MSYVVATLPKGYAIAFASEHMDDVIAANGFIQLNEVEVKERWEDAIIAMEARNEEIERKRNSSLMIVSQGLHSIYNVNGDRAQILAALTKFICETMSKGEFTYTQVDQMITYVSEHLDRLMDSQTDTFNRLKDAVLDEDPVLDEDSYWDEEGEL